VTLKSLRAPLLFLGVYLLLTLAAFWMGETYVVAWLPLFKLETDWLLPRGLHGDSVMLATYEMQRLVELHATTTVRQTFENGVLPAGVALKSSTLLAYVLYHPIITYATLAAWPVTVWRQRITLLLLGVPCVLITTSLDIPFVLVGLAQDLILGNLAPQDAGSDPRALYYAFMHGGGRAGLALAGALSTALVAARIDARTTARKKRKSVPSRNVNSSAQKRHRVAVTAR
jgi:hypothetical protein